MRTIEDKHQVRVSAPYSIERRPRWVDKAWMPTTKIWVQIHLPNTSFLNCAYCNLPLSAKISNMDAGFVISTIHYSYKPDLIEIGDCYPAFSTVAFLYLRLSAPRSHVTHYCRLGFMSVGVLKSRGYSRRPSEQVY